MIRRNEVTRTEWRWVIVWIVVALIVTSIPYFIGLLRSTPDHVFSGFVIAVEDGFSYLAKMGEGARGLWLFHLPYTSEPHIGTLLYIFHLLLGKVAALSGLAPIVVYQLARLIFGATLLLVVYRFIAMFTASRAVRRIAFLLIVFSGGLGWLLILLGQPNWLDSIPIDLISPEAFTFLVLYGFPHIALARTLMLLGLIELWEKDRPLRAGLYWLGMGVIVPFYVAVVYAIVGAGLIATSIAQRRIHWREVRRSIAAGLIAAPTVIYTFVVVGTDPIWAEWAAQLIILSPHPLHYVLAFALVGGLAVIGIIYLLHNPHSPISNLQRPTSNLQSLISNFYRLIGWSIIVPFLVYLPFNSQRRLIEGWQIPLSILAAVALVYRVLPAWRRSRLVRRLSQQPRYSARGLQCWALSSLLAFSFATYGLLLTEESFRMLGQQPPSFRDGREVRALAWLDQQVTYQDVVLSSYNTGNYLPAQVGARVFLGHGPETAFSDQKREWVAAFYASSTSDDWRRAFLHDWPITYVIDGPLEQTVGAFDPSSVDYLALVYDRDGYRIYRVKAAAP
jgi:hypothetical protein